MADGSAGRPVVALVAAPADAWTMEMSRALEGLGYDVAAGTSFEEAISLSRRKPGDFTFVMVAPSVDDAGLWARGTVSLERLRDGGVALGGVVTDSGAPRLVVRRPGDHGWVRRPPRPTPTPMGPAALPHLSSSPAPAAPFAF